MWHLRGPVRCVWGLLEPPYLSWLWSKFWPKSHVSLIAGINFNSFGPFSEFIFKKSQKHWQKLKNYQKLLKMSENSKFCNFWDISTCNTSKETIFLIEFNFTQKKYDLIQKNQFFLFEFEFDMKNAFFWGIACWNISKITKVKILAHF